MKYQKTSIGEIPADWNVLQIKELVKTYAGGTPLRSKESYYGGNILWVKSGEVDQERIYDTEEKITDEGFKKSSAKKVPKNSVLIAMYGATAGKVGILKSEGTTNQAVLALPPNDDKYHYEFIYYMLSYHTARFTAITQGTGQPNLSKQVIDNVKIALPPLSEQHKIAKILINTDQAIKKSEEIIDKSECLKKGITQKLLTEGIGHDKFKDTPIGIIPVNWDVNRLGDITQVTVGHVGPISQYYTDNGSGIPLLSTKNISKNWINLKDLKFVSKEFQEKNKKSKVFAHDLIIARHGASGSASVVPAELNGAQSLNVVIVRASGKFESKFIESLFNFGYVKTRLAGWKSGSVQGVVNTGVLEKFKIPIPPLSEQKKIVTIISNIDKKIMLELKHNEKLQNIKKGLMNDLLTGRKRVLVNNR